MSLKEAEVLIDWGEVCEPLSVNLRDPVARAHTDNLRATYLSLWSIYVFVSPRYCLDSYKRSQILRWWDEFNAREVGIEHNPDNELLRFRRDWMEDEMQINAVEHALQKVCAEEDFRTSETAEVRRRAFAVRQEHRGEESLPLFATTVEERIREVVREYRAEQGQNKSQST